MEEKKKIAVELTDDELDKAAGGIEVDRGLEGTGGFVSGAKPFTAKIKHTQIKDGPRSGAIKDKK